MRRFLLAAVCVSAFAQEHLTLLLQVFLDRDEQRAHPSGLTLAVSTVLPAYLLTSW